jgi:hypothetical protein
MKFMSVTVPSAITTDSIPGAVSEVQLQCQEHKFVLVTVHFWGAPLSPLVLPRPTCHSQTNTTKKHTRNGHIMNPHLRRGRPARPLHHPPPHPPRNLTPMNYPTHWTMHWTSPMTNRMTLMSLKKIRLNNDDKKHMKKDVRKYDT